MAARMIFILPILPAEVARRPTEASSRRYAAGGEQRPMSQTTDRADRASCDRGREDLSWGGKRADSWGHKIAGAGGFAHEMPNAGARRSLSRGIQPFVVTLFKTRSAGRSPWQGRLERMANASTRRVVRTRPSETTPVCL